MTIETSRNSPASQTEFKPPKKTNLIDNVFNSLKPSSRSGMKILYVMNESGSHEMAKTITLDLRDKVGPFFGFIQSAATGEFDQKYRKQLREEKRKKEKEKNMSAADKFVACAKVATASVTPRGKEPGFAEKAAGAFIALGAATDFAIRGQRVLSDSSTTTGPAEQSS